MSATNVSLALEVPGVKTATLVKRTLHSRRKLTSTSDHAGALHHPTKENVCEKRNRNNRRHRTLRPLAEQTLLPRTGGARGGDCDAVPSHSMTPGPNANLQLATKSSYDARSLTKKYA